MKFGVTIPNNYRRKPPALPGDSQSLTVPGVKETDSLR
jgi:hypothetical protein